MRKIIIIGLLLVALFGITNLVYSWCFGPPIECKTCPTCGSIGQVFLEQEVGTGLSKTCLYYLKCSKGHVWTCASWHLSFFLSRSGRKGWRSRHDRLHKKGDKSWSYLVGDMKQEKSMDQLCLRDARTATTKFSCIFSTSGYGSPCFSFQWYPTSPSGIYYAKFVPGGSN